MPAKPENVQHLMTSWMIRRSVDDALHHITHVAAIIYLAGKIATPILYAMGDLILAGITKVIKKLKSLSTKAARRAYILSLRGTNWLWGRKPPVISLSRAQINKMKKDDLIALAITYDMDCDSESSTAALKKCMIKHAAL
jgi:hypothetical protein